MSYEAKVFRVMIASPGDVKSERAIVRDCVNEWNVIHSDSRKIVLLPVGWETHSSPDMGAAPQQIINEKILDKCDVLVGVFWTRIGTPTTAYASGTIEEIERHIQTGNPTMLYFSSQPAVPDSIDHIQYEQLKNFKASCRSRGLYETYDDLTDFKDKFFRQLQIKLNEHEIFIFDEQPQFTAIVESDSKIPAMSKEAKILLVEISKDSSGTLISLRYIGGSAIQTNGRNFAESNDRREIAKWESAVAELVNLGLIITRGPKGEIFEITNLGYQVADVLTAST